MRSLLVQFAVASIVLAGICRAVPLTVKEVAFHLRTGLPEAEILRDLAQRRLLTPLDAAGEKQLAASGASAGLIAQLKSGAFTLSPEQAQVAALRQSAQQQAAAQQAAADHAQAEARNQRNTAVAGQMLARGTVQTWLKDQLVTLENGRLKPFDPAKIGGTRVFAFYASAAWCGPCKKFSPKLVAAYRALKEKHPELEVVFVSSDRDEFNMAEYMRAYDMPWPALKFRQMPPPLAGFFGSSIPWLVLVGDDGRPLSQNGVDKKYLDPERLLTSLDPMLTELKARGL
jgi:nucleoredoxin